jgi:2-oxoglutarate dehydrogenase complex dehydrogenase (E1) component-like enzyme
MIEEGAGLDWSMGENCLLRCLTMVSKSGFPARCSSAAPSRNAMRSCRSQTGKLYTPLNHLVKDQQVKIEVINSMLSEEAVLGFEYGYAGRTQHTHPWKRNSVTSPMARKWCLTSLFLQANAMVVCRPRRALAPWL